MTAKRTEWLGLLAGLTCLVALALTSCATTYHPPADPWEAKVEQNAKDRQEEKIDAQVGEEGGTNLEDIAIEAEQDLPPGEVWEP